MAKDSNKISDYIEWTTIPYRTIRFWVIVIGLLLVAGGCWFVQNYLNRVTSKSATEDQAIENRSARFASVDGEVKVKKLEAMDWTTADSSSTLYAGDLIRTSEHSSCRIVFFDGTVYEVKPNSLISIRESYEERSTQRRMVNVELASGSVDLSTASKNQPQSKAKIETSNLVADAGAYSRTAASYDKEKGSSTIRVASGVTDLLSRATGQHVTAGSNEEVSVQGKNVNRRMLPAPPQLYSPRMSEVYPTPDPRRYSITLEWGPIHPEHFYRISVSDQPGFQKILSQAHVKGLGHHTVTGLPYGNYFWKVTPIDANGVEGFASSIASFAIRPERVNRAQSVKLDIQKIVVLGSILEVIGKTDPDNYLSINGKIVLIEKDGTFKHFTDPFENTTTASLEFLVKDYSGAVRHFSKTVRLE